MANQIFGLDLGLGDYSASEKPLRFNKVFSGSAREFIEISINAGEVLSKHFAKVPIAVIGLTGIGKFYFGEELSEMRKLEPGVLITLSANILHEVKADEDLRFLLVKFNSN
jgi:quercetin dioxygenase-like cupin family protein